MTRCAETSPQTDRLPTSMLRVCPPPAAFCSRKDALARQLKQCCGNQGTEKVTELISSCQISTLKRPALATGADPRTARVLRGRCRLGRTARRPTSPVAASGDPAGPRKEAAHSTG